MDRNVAAAVACLWAYVVPYVGTWIEILAVYDYNISGPSRSLRGNVDRNIEDVVVDGELRGRSLRGNVDRNSVAYRTA